MIRVTKTRGWIVVLDTDWCSLSIDTTEADIERRLAHLLIERGLRNGYSGRQLLRLLRQQKLTEIKIEVHPLLVTDYAFARQVALLDKVEHLALTTGVVSEEDDQRWRASLERADSINAFFGTVNQIMTAGRKP
jgi:hypothetical protein